MNYTVAWAAISYIRLVLIYFITIFYFVYLGFAAKAVHRWRGRTGRRRGVQGELVGRLSLSDERDRDAVELGRYGKHSTDGKPSSEV